MSKKYRTLALLTIASILTLSLLGCQTAPSTPAANSPAITKDKAITIVISEDPPSFNPMVSDSGFDALVMELVLLGMTDVDPDGNVFPELAAELPTLDNGGVSVDEEAGSMSVTWKMRQDVQWQDGKPVTADDMLFTWNAIHDPQTGSWIPGIDSIESVEKVDQYTFVVNYSAIYPGYLTQFGGEQIAVWPAHYCDAAQGFVAWDCGRQPLSDGPFVLKDWVEGDHMTFLKNENYFEEGKPSIEKVTVQIVPDDAVRKTMMQQGDADIDMWINVNTINDLKSSETAKVSLSPSDRFVMRLFMNQAEKGTVDAQAGPHPILSDVRVRQAIRMAVDVDTINNEIFFGLGHPVWTEFFRPPYNQCDVPRPVYDPEAAKSLLEEAGWTDSNNDGTRECHGCASAEEGYEMRMEFITYAEYGEPLELTQQLIGEMLGKIGIQVDLTVVEGSVLWADAESGGIELGGNFDIDIWDDGYAGVDPTDFLWELYSIEAATPGYGWNLAHWKNEELNSLIDAAYTLDETSRQETFCKMADIFDKEVPLIMLFTVPNADAYSSRLEGVQSTVNDLVTWNIADWKIK
jgi:peptide/nickel transport system substrate-binding protein